jgi:hypothetical protein
MDSGIPDSQRGSAIDIDHVVDIGGNLRMSTQINPAKPDAEIL